MKAISLALILLVSTTSATKLTRDLPAKPLSAEAGIDIQSVISTSEADDFKKEVEQAKKDSAKYQQKLAEEAKLKPKPMPTQAQVVMAKINVPNGKIMEDGLIHTPDGKMFFQNGKPVGGVNLDQF